MNRLSNETRQTLRLVRERVAQRSQAVKNDQEDCTDELLRSKLAGMRRAYYLALMDIDHELNREDR